MMPPLDLRRLGVAAILFCFLLFASVVLYFYSRKQAETDTFVVAKSYTELQFRVIHRPHITYLVDLRYMLCFATRKPDYQDLVQFECTQAFMKKIEKGLEDEIRLGK